MTKDSIRKFVIQTTMFKTLTISDFVDNIISDINTSNIFKAVIILNNVPFHKHKVIIEKSDVMNHILLYLLPYFLFLDPIVNMFTKWELPIAIINPYSLDIQVRDVIKNIFISWTKHLMQIYNI